MPDLAQQLTEAQAAHRAGQSDRAEALCQQIVADDPESFDAHYLLGIIRHQRGKLPESIASLSEAVRLQPEHAEAHNHLGAVLAAHGDLDEAVAGFERARRLDPLSSAAAANLRRALANKAVQEGVPLAERGRWEEAAAHFARAINWLPDYVEAHNNLGFVLQAQGNVNDAIAAFRRAVALNPDYLPGCVNLGATLERAGRADEALPWLERAVRLGPHHSETHNNLGVALHSFGRLDEALASFNRAIELDPDNAGARLNRALALLLRGNFLEGWREFEWRGKRAGPGSPCPRQPRWTGEPLDGRIVLLLSEEGMGDTLQFVRYAELVKRKGARVVLQCPAALAALAATARGVDDAVSIGSPLPEFDFYAPLMSLPAIFGTALANIPAHVPYLWPEASLVDAWKEELDSRREFKVGIAWQGNPAHRSDRYRSIPLARFAGVARLPGVHLYSLQLGPGREQLADWNGKYPITDFGDRLGDFQHTAAIMRNLDLIITCDSAPAHLAGALGVPVWVALALTPDWRWLLERGDSPWYPSARLFRQKQLGDWETVFQEIERELAKLAHRAREGYS